MKKLLQRELKKGSKSVSEKERNMVILAYQFLEKLLQSGKKYISADHITIADFSVIPTVTTLDVSTPLNTYV